MMSPIIWVGILAGISVWSTFRKRDCGCVLQLIPMPVADC